MDIKKIIKIFYLIFSIYILSVVSITDISLVYILPSIIILWVNYIAFLLGRKLKTNNFSIIHNDIKKPFLLQQNKQALFFIGISTIVLSIIVTEYYTGQTPISAFANFQNEISLYYEYQHYFSNNSIQIFSFSKIPYILMMFYIKFILFISYINFGLIKDKLEKFDYFYLFLVTFAQSYFALVRGTNFEFFELTIMLIFIVFNKNKQKKTSPKTIITIVITILVMISGYYNSVTSRGFQLGFNFTPDIHYEPNSFLATLFPSISFIIAIVFDYFGFGFFYISTFFNRIWMDSFHNFIAGLIPRGFEILNYSYISDIIKNMIDLGSRWHPDTVTFINSYGYIGLLIICFIMGYITSSINNSNNKSNIAYLIEFMILLQMISFPIGNFIVVSSSNKLIVLFIGAYWFWKRFIKFRIRFE